LLTPREQADCRRTGNGGEDRESPPWSGDGEARCQLGGWACEIGSKSVPRACGKA
jgi:hypothetical protein